MNKGYYPPKKYYFTTQYKTYPKANADGFSKRYGYKPVQQYDYEVKEDLYNYSKQ